MVYKWYINDLTLQGQGQGQDKVRVKNLFGPMKIKTCKKLGLKSLVNIG